MPEALTLSPHEGRIVWLGRVVDRAAGLDAQSVEALDIAFGGPRGEAHSGALRPSCARVKHIHPKGTDIANARQMTLLGAEELAHTARDMGVERIDPAWVGGSIVVEGIPDLTHLPPSSRLQGPDGVTLVVDMENLPCTQTGKAVDRFLPGKGKLYKPAAMHRRGVTLWTERPGRLRLGDRLRLFIPAQRAWQG